MSARAYLSRETWGDVTDGRIQFLGDCTHDLAGQTVDLDDEIDLGGWDVRESWLRKVPAPGGDGMMHIYATKPGRGARAVTVRERPRGWSFWCINHPMEPATSGHPVSFSERQRRAYLEATGGVT